MDIVTRAEWGARYSNGFGPAPIPAQEVWLHHSVTAAPRNPEAEMRAMRQLEAIGQSRFGGGVSYTWAVMPSGRVFEGHGVNRRGAHTKGRNSIARAIVLVGNYENDRVSDDQVRSVIQLLEHAKRQGWISRARLAGGHRQAPGASTACPGRFGMAAIPIVNGVRTPETGSDGPAPATGPRSLPTLREGSTGPYVVALREFMRRVFPSYAGDLPTGGTFDPHLKRVMMDFQGRVRIEKDGVVGPVTNRHLWERGYRGL